MRVVKFASVFYLFFISCFFTFNVLQGYPELRSDRDDKPYRHKLGWANKNHHLYSPHLSPGLINLYTYLGCSDISNYENADLRKTLLCSLSTKEFLEVYNEFQMVRDWPESEDVILRILQENDYNKVKTLITGFDLEHFITWYPQVIYNYESSKRMNECYRKLLYSQFDKNSHDGSVIFSNADKIKNAVVNGPKFSDLTPVDTSLSSAFKNCFGCGTDRRSKITWDAKSYIEDNFSSDDYFKVLAEFNTVEQRALQGKIINNFNRIAKLSYNAPVKKQEFLKEAGTFSIVANEYNHSGLIEFGNKAAAICEKLLEFTMGIGEGVWNGVVGFKDIVMNPSQALQSLEVAAKWCDDLLTGSMITLLNSDRSMIPFIEIRYPEVMIKDALQVISTVLKQSSARDFGRLTGEVICLYYGPKTICKQGSRLMASSAAAVKSLDIGSKVWRLVKVQERLVLLTELGPIQVFAADVANFMAETQRASGAAGRIVKAYMQNLKPRLLDPLISAQKMEKRVLNFMEMFVSLEEAEQVLFELKEIGTKFNNRVKCPSISDQIFKFDLDHLFGLDIAWKGEDVVNRLSGFHFDPGGLIEKAGKVIFSKMEKGPLGLYKALVSYGGKTKPSTFFPKAWDRLKVMEKIEESLVNVLEKIPKDGGKILLRGVTSDGIVIDTLVQGVKKGSNAYIKVKSSYPNIKKTIEYITSIE